MSLRFPLFVDLAGKAVVVVGGGAIGLRRAAVLQRFGARVTVIAPVIREKPEGIACLLRSYRPGDLAGAFLAVAATNDRAVNHAVYEEARGRGILVNVCDCPDECDFYFPALITAGDVTIGISTGGASPALAAALRAWLEQKLPENLAEIARRAEALRGTMPPKEYAALVHKMLEEGV